MNQPKDKDQEKLPKVDAMAKRQRVKDNVFCVTAIVVAATILTLLFIFNPPQDKNLDRSITKVDTNDCACKHHKD